MGFEPSVCFFPQAFLLAFTLWHIWQELSTLSSTSIIRLQMDPVQAADLPARRVKLLLLLTVLCSFSPLISHIHSPPFLTRVLMPPENFLTLKCSPSPLKNWAFLGDLLCSFSFSLQQALPAFEWFTFFKKSEFFVQCFLSPKWGHLSSHYVQSCCELFVLTLFGNSRSSYELWSRPRKVSRLLGLHCFTLCSLPEKQFK